MRIPILMYHALDDQRSAISIPSKTFERQMHALHESGFQVISLGQLVQCLRTGNPVNDRSVVISFDDGLESVYTSAFPILKQFGFPATVYLVAGYCGRWNDWPSQPSDALRFPMMTWPQIREMDRHGIEFGAHTFSHPRLDQVPPEALNYEVLESKSAIEESLGHSVDMFAYPYGRHDKASEAVIRDTYAGACTTRLGLVGPHSDPLALERVDAHYVQHPFMLRHLFDSAFSGYIGFRRQVRAVASTVMRRDWV